MFFLSRRNLSVVCIQQIIYYLECCSIFDINLFPMSTHYTLTDHEFEQQFSDGSMDPTLFSHEAHLRLAWIHIRKYGLKQAEHNLSVHIKAFATLNGDAQKYNETVTIAAVNAVHHFLKASKPSSFQDFMLETPQLKEDFVALLNSHYSIDIFTSPEAKRRYFAPDLVPFISEHMA